MIRMRRKKEIEKRKKKNREKVKKMKEEEKREYLNNMRYSFVLCTRPLKPSLLICILIG